MTKTKLQWRLKTLPTVEELQNLVKDKIITQDEARGILFNNETEETRDSESLKSEIKFLRELVEKLSKGETRIIEVIKEINVPYYERRWYKPYEVWCGTLTYNNSGSSTVLYNSGTSGVNLNADTTCGLNNAVNASFTSIQTF